jgi:DNA polymerase-3 subunit chi
VEEEHAAGRRVYVWASSEAQARELDELLWTFRDDSFVPHGLWQGQSPFDEPVAVGWRPGNPNAADCLVLARDASPPEIAGFARVVDFAPVDEPALREAARTRFRAFRDAGLPVRFHGAA